MNRGTVIKYINASQPQSGPRLTAAVGSSGTFRPDDRFRDALDLLRRISLYHPGQLDQAQARPARSGLRHPEDPTVAFLGLANPNTGHSAYVSAVDGLRAARCSARSGSRCCVRQATRREGRQRVVLARLRILTRWCAGYCLHQIGKCAAGTPSVEPCSSYRRYSTSPSRPSSHGASRRRRPRPARSTSSGRGGWCRRPGAAADTS